MRRVSSFWPLLVVFLVLTAAGAWAGETQTPPTDPPEARLNPPGGVTAQARVNPPVGIAPPPPDTTLQGRIAPPVGVTTQARAQPPVGGTARLQPPGGATLTDMILLWLQSRISVPNG